MSTTQNQKKQKEATNCQNCNIDIVNCRRGQGENDEWLCYHCLMDIRKESKSSMDRSGMGESHRVGYEVNLQ